jgi:hypothetical protein
VQLLLQAACYLSLTWHEARTGFMNPTGVLELGSTSGCTKTLLLNILPAAVNSIFTKLHQRKEQDRKQRKPLFQMILTYLVVPI